MAKLLMTVWPFPTHLQPQIAVAHALRERGHDAVFYTAASAAPLLEGEGFRCFPFRRLNWSRVEAIVDELVSQPKRTLGTRTLWRRFLVDTLPDQLEDLEPLVGEWRPDAVVCDLSMWGPILFLNEECRLPVAVLSHLAYCLLPGSEGRVPGVAIARKEKGRKGLRARLPSWLIQWLLRSVPRAADRLRQDRGLRPLGTKVTEFIGTMPLYLIPGIRDLDYGRHDLPASVHYVGPCLWRNGNETPPAWTRQLPPDRPCVLAEEGALYTPQAPALEAVARGLAELPLQVVVLAGKGRRPGSPSLGRLGSNVRFEAWTPLHHVLPLADVVVTTGNTESVLAALMEGLPLVVAPSLWDQTEVALRIEEAGAGLCLRPGDCTPEHLRQAVETVRTTSGFGRKARQLGEALTQCDGPGRAAQLLEELIRDERTS
ncbi:MAG: glycosyltransferase [Acidobacteriota bacterium]